MVEDSAEPARARHRPAGSCAAQGSIALASARAAGGLLSRRHALAARDRRRSGVRARELGAGGRLAERRGRRRPDRPRDQHPSLGRQRPVLHAGQPARQHAQLPAGHHRGALALRGRARRPDRAHPRLEPDRPRPRHRLRPAEVPRHGLDLRFRGPRSRRPRARNRSIAGRWRRCATTTSGSPRARRLFETRADNLQATLERIAADIGSSSAALDQQLERGVAASGRISPPTTCSTPTRAGSTPTTCCCARSRSTSTR